MPRAPVLAILVLAGGIGLASQGGQARAAVDEYQTFETPSGNIGCHYIPPEGVDGYVPKGGGGAVQCVRKKPSPISFTLEKTGKGQRDPVANEAFCCDGSNVLPYGRSWGEGPFTCKSGKAGLTCERRDGHGFFLSKSATKAY